MKSAVFSIYLVVGVLVCIWFMIAAVNHWQSPKFQSSGSGYGRSYGGAWGGGK